MILMSLRVVTSGCEIRSHFNYSLLCFDLLFWAFKVIDNARIPGTVSMSNVRVIAVRRGSGAIVWR